MKNFLLFWILLLPTIIKSQNISSIVLNTQFEYQQINESTHKFSFHTFFSIGAQTTCPPVTNTEISFEADTMYVKNYYDIRGAWSQLGCERTNEVYYNHILPTGVNYIKSSTNVITYDDANPNDSLIVNDLYYQIFELNHLSAQNIESTEKINLYPNPVKDRILTDKNIDLKKYQVVNSLGQIIAAEIAESKNSINVEYLSKGVYHLILFDKKGNTKHFKFIKQ